MTNAEMRKEIQGTYGINRFAADEFIATRAKIVAGIASPDAHYSGFTTKKGILFSHISSQGIVGECRVAHAWFSFETVLDQPSIVIAWAQLNDGKDNSHV